MKISEISIGQLYNKLSNKSYNEEQLDPITPEMVGGDKGLAYRANTVSYQGKTWVLTNSGWYIFQPEAERFQGVKNIQELNDLNKLGKKRQIEVLSKYNPGPGQGFVLIPDTGDYAKWIPDKNVLTIANKDGSNPVKYQRVGKAGFQKWKDIQSGDIIAPEISKEIDNVFKIASGGSPAVKTKPKEPKPKPNKVTYKNKTYTLGDDGKWRDDEDGAVIANKEGQDLLHKQLIPALQIWQMQTVRPN